MNLVELLMLMNAKASASADVLKLFKNLRAAKLKAVYKCEQFAMAYAPKATQKKSVPKKSVPKKSATKQHKKGEKSKKSGK